MQKVGQLAYQLKLPPQTKIHHVFHVSQLKWINGSFPATAYICTDLTADLELQAIPAALLGVRGILPLEVLIKWQNQPAEEATWE